MKVLIFLLSLAFLTNLDAQNLDFNISKDIPLRKHDEYQGLIHADTSGYITHIYERTGKGLLNHPGRNLILEKYNKQLDLMFSYEYGAKGMISIELMSTGSSLIWIVMEKVGSYNYSYSMIPIDVNGKEGKKQFLFENKVTSQKDIPFTYMTISPDSTKVAFSAVFDSDQKKKEVEVFTSVFDKSANLSWNKFTTLRGNQKQYEISDFHLTNNSELLMLAKYYKNEKGKNTIKKKNVKQAGYTMSILKINEEDKKATKYPIDLKGSFIHQAAMLIDSTSGHVFCLGMTSPNSGGNINGVFLSQFDDSLNLLNTNQSKFSNQDLIALHKQDADVQFKANKEGLDDDYVISRILLGEDKSMTLIVEENYFRTYNNNMGRVGYYNNSSSRTVEFNSNDIVMVKLSVEGKIDKFNLIPKKQSASSFQGINFFNPDTRQLLESDLFMSHSIMTYEDGLCFFYNEHRDNFDEVGRWKTAESLNRMLPALVRSTPELDTEMSLLFSPSRNPYLISPNRSRQINSNTYFMSLLEPTRNGQKNLRIAIVTVE